MSAIARTNRTLRAAGLLLLGAIGVHWLRYLLAYGSHAPDELHRQGHGYLVELLPSVIALAVALLAGAAAVRVSRRFREGADIGAASVAWYAIALFAVFAVQELSEGAVAAGHPAGLAGLFADGGWSAIPLAFAFALAITGFERVLIRGETRLALLLKPEPCKPRRVRARVPRPRYVAPRPTRPLAFGLARRPPPLRPSV